LEEPPLDTGAGLALDWLELGEWRFTVEERSYWEAAFGLRRKEGSMAGAREEEAAEQKRGEERRGDAGLCAGEGSGRSVGRQRSREEGSLFLQPTDSTRSV
jgi:hypothetical protein